MESRSASAASSAPQSSSTDRSWPKAIPSAPAPAQPEAQTQKPIGPDALLAFAVETAEPAAAHVDVRPPLAGIAWRTGRSSWTIVIAAVAVAIVSAIGVVRFRGVFTPTSRPDTGRLLVDSTPAGARVLVDGEERGLTPLGVTLKPGTHAVTLLNDSARRDFPVTVTAGAVVSQYFEFAPVSVAPKVGRLSVTADVPGSRVSIDGRARGTAPLVLADLTVGEHTVTVTGEGGSLERRVTIEPGGTASLVFSLPKAAGPSAGWLQIAAPFDVQLYEGSDLVGSGSGAKIMLPAGRHEIRVVSQALGYEDVRRLEIPAGKTAALKVDAPRATVSANARPWADVIVDGNSMGQTPLANLSIAIGPHEVVFRHPQLGEQRQTIVVTAKGPNRISADMTKK